MTAGTERSALEPADPLLVRPSPRSLDRWPFDPSKRGFYSGWVIFVVGSIGILASCRARPPASACSQLSIAYLIGTGASGFLLPRSGRAIDRYGSTGLRRGGDQSRRHAGRLSTVGPMSYRRS